MGRTRIDPAWQAWVAENLALGATLAEVRSALEEEGVSKSDATRVIKAVSDNPLFAGFVRERRMRARRDQVLALTERLRRTATIARRRTPSAEEFFSRFYATSTPCIFTDFTEGWAARDWTPSWLRETLRGVPVEIQSGRSGRRGLHG